MKNCFLNRRKFLKTAAGAAAVMATGVGPFVRKAHANTVDADTRFELTDPEITLTTGVVLAIKGERMQSGAFGQSSKLFTVQQPSGGTSTGALVLSYVNWDSTTDTIGNWAASHGTMTLTDFGHGQNLGVTYDGTDYWIWIECGAPQLASGTTFGTQICRFKWKEGDDGTYSTSDIGESSTKLPNSYLYTDLQPGASSLSCSVDTISNRLLLRFVWHDADNPPQGGVSYSGPYNVAQYAVYDLDTLTAAGGYEALPTMPCFLTLGAPTISNGAGGTETSTPMQGMTFMENFVYQISGTGNGDSCTPGADEGNVCISAFDMRNPSTCNFTHVDGALYLNEHEPEGIWIQRTGSSQRLMYCFTSSASCSGGSHTGNQLANFYYKEVETDTLLTSCSIS